MKKRYFTFISIFLLTIITFYPTNFNELNAEEVNGSEIVVFNDPNLEREVANNLGVNVGEITQSDMERLVELQIGNDGITDLTGLEYAVNLEILDASFNEITDLTPISNLTSLTSLNITGNYISDISTLKNLINLKTLEIGDNNITDISVVENMYQLTKLDVSLNGLSDISPISGLNNLEIFISETNDISDISALTNLDNLTEIYLIDNKITDVSPLTNKPKLDIIDISENNISDISPLAQNKNTSELYAENQTIEMDDLYVNNSNEIVYDVTGIKGDKIIVSLGKPTEFNSSLEGTWEEEFEDDNSYIYYSGSILQNVYVVDEYLAGKSREDINEETVLTDQQLIELFEVSEATGKEITVDQSDVNYSVPGTYKILFSADKTPTKVSYLDVKDVKPTLNLTPRSILIEQNQNIDDVLMQINVEATEIIDNDLLTNVTYDDSQINYNKPGIYILKSSVVDNEGNKTNANVTVNVLSTTSSSSGVDTSTTNNNNSSDNGSSQNSSITVSNEDSSIREDSEGLNETGYNLVYLIYLIIFIIIVLLICYKFIKK